MIIAVDIGGTNLRVALLDKNGKFLKKKKVSSTPFTNINNKLIAAIKDVATPIELDEVEIIGICSLGDVNNEKGTVNPPRAENANFNISSPLKKVFNKELFLINDATAAAYGEYTKLKDKKNNLVYLTISTGIGGGVVYNGNLLAGQTSSPAEFGHIIVKEEDYALPCKCGHLNHWEAFTSGTGLPNFLRAWAEREDIKLSKNYKTAAEIFEDAQGGDENLKKFFDKVGEFNGQGISTIIAVYYPEIIVLGGSVVLNNKDLILNGIKKNIEKNYKTPEILVTSSGDDAGLFGVAQYIIDKKLRDR